MGEDGAQGTLRPVTATAKPNRAASRSAARRAAVQALYQHEMEATKLPVLLTEFHNHRLGAEIEDEQYHDAEVAFFDDLVTGVDARSTEIEIGRALCRERVCQDG